jgi:hypothetical protein
VILCSADGEGDNFMVPAYPAQVSPQARLPLLRDGIAAVLGAEDQVEVNTGKGMSHGAAPSGLDHNLLRSLPTAAAVGYVLSSLPGLSLGPQSRARRNVVSGAFQTSRKTKRKILVQLDLYRMCGTAGTGKSSSAEAAANAMTA